MIFSVIVPFHNEQKYIGLCLNSLTKQNFDRDKYEIIFINSCSTDSSSRIIKLSEGLKTYKIKVANPYTARNLGIEKAKGKYLAFTDAHCLIDTNWLNEAYKTITLYKPDIILGKRLFNSINSRYLNMLENFENTKISYTLSSMSHKYYFGFTNNMIVRTRLFHNLGTFTKQRYGGDVEFVQRYTHYSGYKPIIYNQKLIVTHLEINTSWKWIQKYFYYGTGYSELVSSSTFKPLSLFNNFKVYLLSVSKSKYSLFDRIVLMLLLACKSIAYNIGICCSVIKTLYTK